MTRGVALLTAGVVALAVSTPAVQLAFAIVGIGVVGMAHGAGDLAVVEHGRRPAFLAAYGLVALATLLWWTADPAAALPAFLIASALHFGIEDAPSAMPAERVARGLVLIAAPATLHVDGYAALLRLAGGAGSSLPTYAPAVAVIGGAAAAMLLVVATRGRDLRLAGGVAALLLLPPLVGFTVGFLVLHALPQTVSRKRRLGLATTADHLRSVAPVFAGAVILAGGIAMLLLHADPTGVRGLFAGIAALAMPHLLVTPWFEARMHATRPRLAHRTG